MDYTKKMNGLIRRTLIRFSGLILAVVLASCTGGNTPPATPTADSAPTSLPPAPRRISPESLPQICDCILRFDHISIEEGLSQSSARVIFQDSRGFLWIGTEDGLNRYDGYNFKNYKPDPDVPTSLSDRFINAIVEDKNGYLWIGTRLGGLNRYDPRTEQFVQFTHDDTDPRSISNNMVNVLYIDREGNLWVGTPSGLDRFDEANSDFLHQRFSPLLNGKTLNRNITAIYEDSENRLWIGSTDGGLTRIDPKGSFFFFSYQHDDNNENTISQSSVTSIAEDKDGALWVGTRNGLNRFEPNTGHFERFMHEDNESQSISNNVINALLFDSTGNLWIATGSGLDRLDVQDRSFTHYQHDPTFLKSLSEDSVISIYEDRGGVLWFGTYGGGVNKYDRQRDNFAYYRNDPNNPNTLSDNFIFAIYPDSDGYVWLGTSTEGLNRFDTTTKNVKVFRNDPSNPRSISSNRIYSIAGDQDGILWIGTTNGLERFEKKSQTFSHFVHDTTKPDSLSANRVYKVFIDSKDNLWLGTPAGLDLYNRRTHNFTHFTSKPNDKNSLSGGYINSIIEDKDGNLWLGTFDSGLNKFDPATGTFTRYRYNAKDKMSISNDAIYSIHQDAKGRIWIGTGGGGLNLYHPETDSFTYYLEKNGLPNGVVYGILEDDEGNLWMSTNFGISRFDPDTETFRNFDEGDGLQSNEFNSGAYARSNEGEFYFGGIGGLTVFNPVRILDNPYVPQVTLTSLTQGDQPVSVESSVETTRQVILEWPQNSFEFEFAGLSYNQPNKNRYAYILENFDTNWHFIGTKHSGRYTNLPGGEYTLLLKSTNSDGVWNDNPLRINVTIVPPYWQTVWFRVLLSIFVVVVVAVGFRLRTRAIQERNRELERLVQERTYALEKRGQEMEALYQADEKILRNVSLNQVFQTLVDVAVDMLHADRSVVFAWDEKQTKVVPRVSHGYSPETLKVMEFAKGEGNVGEVLATGKPIIANTLDPDTMRPDVREAIIAEGIQSFVHLPIVVDHKVIGVFNIAFTRPDLIPEDTVKLFAALTHRASISIANMELFEQTKDLAVMEERNRLARDLHDSAKQKAFAALAQLGTARGLFNGQNPSASMHLSEAENLVSDVIQELTFLVQEIYPIALQEKGLSTALREYIFEWEGRNDITVKFKSRDERRLPLGVEQAIYRVTQETLANIARHSHARRVDMSLVYGSDSLQLSISDDGQGFDVGQKLHGMGLRSIRERISSIHGNVQVQSAPGQGTRLLVQVPIKG